MSFEKKIVYIHLHFICIFISVKIGYIIRIQLEFLHLTEKSYIFNIR